MIEKLQIVKKTSSGTLTLENFTVTYNSEKETDKVATFGPWSIEGDTEHLSTSQVNALGAILDAIREIESE